MKVGNSYPFLLVFFGALMSLWRNSETKKRLNKISLPLVYMSCSEVRSIQRNLSDFLVWGFCVKGLNWIKSVSYSLIKEICSKSRWLIVQVFDTFWVRDLRSSDGSRQERERGVYASPLEKVVDFWLGPFALIWVGMKVIFFIGFYGTWY